MRLKDFLMNILWLTVMSTGMYIAHFSSTTDGEAAGVIITFAGIFLWVAELIHITRRK